MKKLIASVLVSAMLLPVSVSAENRPDFVTTPKGMIIEYYGENDVYIPTEINGRTIYDIGDKVFFDMDIASVYVEDGILTIGKSAFEGSKITTVSLPESIIELGDRTFANCTNLKEIYCYHKMPLFGADALKGTGAITVYIPCKSNQNAWEAAIETVKGDKNYTIDYNHKFTANAAGDKVVCSLCGKEVEVEVEYVLPFMDVPADAWYRTYVEEAHQSGIINGKRVDRFDPDAGMTVAEAVKIAASIYASENRENISKASGDAAWYQPYIDFCYDKNIIESGVELDWEKAATRAEMSYLFARCSSDMAEINTDATLNMIPDVDTDTLYNSEILKLYKTGIAVGSDSNYTFNPNSGVTRSEAAAFIARIINNTYRIELK